MRIRFLCLIGAAALVTGCSQQSMDNVTSNGPASNESAAPEPANAAAPAAGNTAASGGDELRTLAECSSTLEAVARLYQAMSSSAGASEAMNLIATGSERTTAALTLELRADTIERQRNPNAIMLRREDTEVAHIRTARAAAIEAERARQPFEQFAIWLGRESDRCMPLVPAQQ